MKKYFIIAAAAALTLAACSKVTMDEAPEQAIAFQAAKYSVGTKAASANESELYKESSFKVWAYFTPTNWATDHNTYNPDAPFMNGVEVAYNATSGVETWATVGGDYYWPKTGKLSFIGVYPFGLANAAPEALDGEAKIGISTYTVAETVKAQKANHIADKTLANSDQNDLMVTALVKDQTSNDDNDGYQYYTKGVAMLFNHIMAKININASLDASATGAVVADDKKSVTINGIKYAVTVDDIQIKSIQKTGAYTASVWTRKDEAARDGNSGPMLGATEEVDGAAIDRTTWTAATSAAPVTAPTDVLLTEGNETQVANYYVMPQNLLDASTISVKYTVYVLNADGKVISAETHWTGETHEGAQADIKLNSITKKDTEEGIVAWNENTIYNYNLKISPVSKDPIYFDAAMYKWSEVDANPAIVEETK